MYKEELLSKRALLVVNKMDLPDADDKLSELQEQLQNPHGNNHFDDYSTVNAHNDSFPARVQCKNKGFG